jgi:hypothetical protein
MIGNSASFSILFPVPYRIEVSRLRQQLEDAHLAWSIDWKRQQAAFEIENIRFVHDPLWNRRIFSLQAAHDGEIWFWKATRTLVGFGLFSV